MSGGEEATEPRRNAQALWNATLLERILAQEPEALAIVLGDKAEESFRQAMLGSQGGLSIFFSNWLVGSIMALGLALLFWPAMTWVMEKVRKPNSRPVPAPAGAAVVDRER